jgi:DNA-binding NarL/FixJ family response regulator
VLVDDSLLGHAGLDRLRILAAVAPTAVLLVGVETHPRYPAHARSAGATGYVLLDDAAETLVSAAREAVLTPSSAPPAARCAGAPGPGP